MNNDIKKENKELIEIKYEMAKFDDSDIPAKMENLKHASFVKEIVADVKDVLVRIKEYETEEKAFKAACDAAIKKGREYKEKLVNYKTAVEEKTLIEYEKYKLTERQVDDNGEVTFKVISQLPKGFEPRKGKKTYTYLEEQLLQDHPEYFEFKPILNKELVDEHIMKGLLSVKYRPYKEEDATIVLKESNMKLEEDDKTKSE